VTRADRLYRVWLERELSRITLEEAWERVDEILASDTFHLPAKRRIPYQGKAPGPKYAALKEAA
jgi:hypothetical protein